MEQAPTTDELLERARDIGCMIRATRVYAAYAAAARALDEDQTARELLAAYTRLLNETRERREDGEDPLPGELDELSRLSSLMTANDTVRVYLQAEREYGRLLTAVQQELAKGDLADGLNESV